MIPERIVYINLDERTDRNKEIQEELNAKGLVYERFSGIPHKVGSIGCSESHLNVLKRAHQEGWASVMVFEDDFMFFGSKETFEQKMAAIDSLEEWDMILLAHNCLKSQPNSETFVRIMEAQTTSGYIVNQRFYEKLIAVWEEGLENLKRTHSDYLYTVDQSWKRLQPQSLWYGFSPALGKQRPSWSNISNCNVDYGC